MSRSWTVNRRARIRYVVPLAAAATVAIAAGVHRERLEHRPGRSDRFGLDHARRPDVVAPEAARSGAGAHPANGRRGGRPVRLARAVGDVSNRGPRRRLAADHPAGARNLRILLLT
jgi:hypothetical protein